MARVALAITLAITLAVTLVSLAEAKSPMFRSEAAEHMDAGFKVVKRRGTSAKDFTRIEVSARPLLMVEEPGLIDTNRVTVEMKTGSGGWRVVTGPASMRGGVFRWTEEKVEPCREHRVRIWVHGQVVLLHVFPQITTAVAGPGAGSV